jgi:acetate kinase
MKLLVLNSGSSSLRFKFYESKGWKRLFSGHIDGIGLKNCRLRGDIETKVKAKNHTQALKIALAILQESGHLTHPKEIEAVGHRVVHGGEKYHNPIRITRTVLKDLKKLSDLAPLHNPPNIQGVTACQKLLKKATNVAIFDTGFHATLPEHAYLYGLPYELYRKHGIRKYGFHGTSHKYVAEQTISLLKKSKKKYSKIITCHIGNGVSLTAIKNGKSLDTTMGFTPLEGVMMGTRTGDFDSAVIFYLHDHLKMKLSDIDHLVNKKSGLLGLSGISSDMRPLWKILQNKKSKQYAAVKRAYDAYVYRLAKKIASLTVPLGGLDALVFTAGIGESAWYLRRDICKQLTHLGLNLDPTKNKKTIEGKSGLINKPRTTSVVVMPTNEELKIAKETVVALQK